MKRLIVLVTGILMMGTMVTAEPKDKDGEFFERVQDLVGPISDTDKEHYKIEFKELDTLDQKAAWFKKVILLETSGEDFINFALKSDTYGEEFEIWALEEGLIKGGKDKYVIIEDSDAYKDMTARRDIQYNKHVKYVEPANGEPGYYESIVDENERLEKEIAKGAEELNKHLANHGEGKGKISAQEDGTITLSYIDPKSNESDMIVLNLSEMSQEERKEVKDGMVKYSSENGPNLDPIADNKTSIDRNTQEISSNTKAIDDLRTDTESGIAGVAAMANMEFGQIKKGSVAIGAGIGGYGDATSIAMGVATKPTDNFVIQGSVATDGEKPVIGAGFTYEFKNVFGN